MVYWVGISVAFIPKGYLVRLTDATMPSEVSVRNQRILLLALSSAGKTKASYSLRCTGKNENLVEYLKHHPLKAFKMFLC